MARKIDLDAVINRIRVKMQGSHPASPDSGYDYLYVVSGSSHGGLYLKDSSGRQIGPFITGSASQSSLTSVVDFDKNLLVGTYHQTKTEEQTIGASATGTLLNYTGGEPGIVTKIHIFTGGGGGASSLRDSRIRIYYDGNTTADVDAPLSLFFGAEYMGANTFSAFTSDFIGANSNYSNSGGYYCYIPIPFTTGIKIEFVNGNTGGTCDIWTEIVYYTGVENSWYDGKKLKVSTGVLSNQTVNTVVSYLNVSGTTPGRLLGVYTLIDSAPNSANPATAPMEGNFKIYKDGSASPDYESSGFEEMFGGSFYFAAKANSGNDYTASAVNKFMGITYKSAVTWGGYRFFIPDPIYFTNSLRVTWNCGNSSQVNFTGGVRVAYAVWYYTT